MDSLTENNKLLHILLVSFPSQGHVNPLLRLGRILASKGMFVTFSAPELIGKELRKANNINDEDDDQPPATGLIRFEFFEDEWEVANGSQPFLFDVYMNHLDRTGRRTLPEMLKKLEDKGTPVSCLIINPFLPWVYDVAESLRIPSATLWVQSCASFSSYYHYHHSLVRFPTESEPELDVQLPGMPLLKYDEIPSFLLPGNRRVYLGEAILGQFKNLSKNFCILMDTFYELERETIDHMSKLCPVRTIGPMFKTPTDFGSNNVTGDIIKADDCKEWLDSKPLSSVVYISFGSLVFLEQDQVTEMAYGILNSGVNFLWVLRPPVKRTSYEPHVFPDGFLEKSGDKGKVVQWSQQEQVLAHPSIACFVTHCGWNSTLEALASGVPVLAFPQWGDQPIDAKFLVEEFKVGVRLCRGEIEDRIIPRDEVERCVQEITSGPKAAEIKENAQQWKKKAEAAVAVGGSSEVNVVSFLDEVAKRCTNIDH